MSNSLIPVILAGGKGERFWPLSRKHRPKQFLSLDGSGKSLLQATADRLLPLAGGWDKLWVVTSSQLASGVQAQLPELPAATGTGSIEANVSSRDFFNCLRIKTSTSDQGTGGTSSCKVDSSSI